jgi:hypothetical protein
MYRKRSRRLGQVILAGLIVAVVLVTSGCGGSQQSQQQANQSKAQLDSALSHARSIGVPSSFLSPITQKEKQLSSTSAPFTLFDDTPATNYYLNQSKQYQQLLSQLQTIVDTTTTNANDLAQQDLQNFQKALAAARKQKVGNLSAFAQQYSNDQALLSTAKLPKDYAAISLNAETALNALGLLASTHALLNDFKSTIAQMQAAHLDVSAMQAQYTSDATVLNTITSPADFAQLKSTVNTQYQMAVDNSIQALPFVGKAKLNEFKSQINLLKTYGEDTSSYQQLYNADAKHMQSAKSIQDFLKVSQQIDADMSTMQTDLTQGAASYMIGQLDREANAWGQAHLYHDKFDGNNYILDSGYTMNGVGYWLQQELYYAQATGYYQQLISDENDEFFFFKMMQQDYSDKTPYNQVHATDLQIMQRTPSFQHGELIIVSMVEQAMRYYVNGKLVRSFYVTMGRVERPALPGWWSVEDRASPTEFKSQDPPSSPYWYPPTKINYAILYHWDGYFIHDAWWRVNFGPGTQFPHYDVGGDESFAGNGSHGCINMQEDQAAWLYANTDYNTQIVVY